MLPAGRRLLVTVRPVRLLKMFAPVCPAALVTFVGFRCELPGPTKLVG